MYSSKSNGIEGSWSFIFLHRLVDTRPICITILLAKLNDSLIYLLSPHTSMSVWLLIMRSAIMKKLYSVQTTVVFVMTLFSFLSELSMKLLLFFVFFKLSFLSIDQNIIQTHASISLHWKHSNFELIFLNRMPVTRTCIAYLKKRQLIIALTNYNNLLNLSLSKNKF